MSSDEEYINELKTDADKYANDNRSPNVFYVVMRIGCIHCLCDSSIVGIFTNPMIAFLTAEKYNVGLHEWYHDGENNFEIMEFNINQINTDLFAKKQIKKFYPKKSHDDDDIEKMKHKIKLIDELIKSY